MTDIPSIGFGTYRLHNNTYDSVKYAIKCGYKHIDTAPLYKNEKLVGYGIKDSGINRDNLFITTKISRNELKLNKIVESIENSLKNLSVDYLDLVLLHEPIDYIKNWNLLEEYYNTKGKNKIKNIGVSNFNETHLKNINNQNIYCNQIELNPFLLREPIINYCNSNNIKIVAHTPLTKGEKLNDKKLIELSNKYEITEAQMMLKWSLQNNNIVIPRSKNFKHIEENLSLNSINNIEKDDMEYIKTFDCQYSTHPKYLNYK